jgi:hypothetical protein
MRPRRIAPGLATTDVKLGHFCRQVHRGRIFWAMGSLLTPVHFTPSCQAMVPM